MADDQRVYSDEEFALILRKATELASRAERLGSSSAGLTLAEMKAAAAQVGLDPAFVEGAARMLANTTASPLERLIGGQLRHDHEARFPIKLDEDRAARLLSAVRISAGQAGSGNAGHSSSLGVTWCDGGELEALSVTARAEEDGTCVSVVYDRRGTIGPSPFFPQPECFFPSSLAWDSTMWLPPLAFGASIAGIGGALAAARGYWASSTREVRERISRVMGAIGQTLTQSETQARGFGTGMALWRRSPMRASPGTRS
jgi:hypothetical protein